jgi:hypothetical protein
LQGDTVAARRLYQESLKLLFECHGFKELIAASLEGLAALETEQGTPYPAAQLWGAAEALREAIGVPVSRSTMPATNGPRLWLAQRSVSGTFSQPGPRGGA